MFALLYSSMSRLALSLATLPKAVLYDAPCSMKMPYVLLFRRLNNITEPNVCESASMPARVRVTVLSE